MRYYVPENLDLIKLICDKGNQRWIKHKWKLYFLITAVYRQRWDKRHKDDDYVPINFDVLMEAVGSRYAKDAKTLLIELNIIETNRKYIPGKRSIGYRFTDTYRNSRFKAVPVDEVGAKRCAFGFKLKETTTAAAYLAESLKRVTIDPGFRLFTKTFETFFQEDYYNRSVEFIENGEWFFTIDSNTGRVYNNITSLPKELRPFLRIDGKPLVGIDIANCQPLLLLSLYDNESEKKRFQSVVECGEFYKTINNQLTKPFSLTEQNRLKTSVLVALFDKPRPQASKTQVAIAQCFPCLAKKIEGIRQSNYKYLALMLQRLEAKILINGVVSRIASMNQFPVLTVHDSILVNPSYVETVSKIISAEFEKVLNVKPFLRLKPSPSI